MTAVTGVLVTVKFALVCPELTVTLEGSDVTELLSCRVITAPPDGAMPLRVTMPVELFPPNRLVGFRLTAIRTGG